MPDQPENLTHVLPERVTALVPQTNGHLAFAGKNGERSMHLRDCWRIVRNHKRPVLWILGIVMFLATLQTLFTPDYYVARTRVQVDPESALLQLPTDGSDANAINTYPVYLNTQLQLSRSPGLLVRVVKALDLEHDLPFRMHMVRGGHTIRKILRMGYLGPKDPISTTVGVPLTRSLVPGTTPEILGEEQRLTPYVTDIQNKLLVQQVKELGTVTRDTRLIEIYYGDPNPLLAAKITNGIADALVELNQERRTEMGRITQQFLLRRTDELKLQIRTASQQLADYAKGHNILTLDPGQNTALDRLGVLNRQLVEAENERHLAQASYDTFRDPKAAAALAEQNDKQIVDARANLIALREKRAQLLVGTTENWPETKELNQAIAELEKYINETEERARTVELTNFQSRYNAAAEREQKLRESFDQQRSVMLSQDDAAVTYRLMQQEIDSNKVLLAELLGRMGANDALQAGTTNNIRVVDYAGVPNRDEPMGPFRLPHLIVVFCLAFAFAAGVAFVLEYLNSTLRSPADVEGILHLPALGSIPSIPAPRRPLLSMAMHKFRGNGTNGTNGDHKS